MTKRRFFSLVWRVNALLIFAVGIGALLLLVIAAVIFIKDMGRTRHAGETININEAQVEKAEATLGTFNSIAGSTTMRAPLHLNQEYAVTNSYASKVSKGASGIQNYLYFDPTSQSSHWLITGNRGLILGTTELPAASDPGAGNGNVEAVVYELIDTDSNGDGKLTEDDLKTVAVSNPEGKHLARLFSKVEHVSGLRLAGNGTLVVLYTSDGQLRAADVDLRSNKVVRETMLKP